MCHAALGSKAQMEVSNVHSSLERCPHAGAGPKCLYRWVIALALTALASTACTSSSGANSEPPCVPHDGSYTCLGLTVPVCPDAVYKAGSPYAGCDFSILSCMRCDGNGTFGENVAPMVGTGATCICEDAGYPIPDGASGYWDCIGTGYACQ